MTKDKSETLPLNETEGLRIIALDVENVKRVKAVHLQLDGETAVIGGDNAQGKSSILDSVEYAFGGKGIIPTEPIRHGEDHASVKVDIGDFTVTREWRRRGAETISELVVRNPDGTKAEGTPQALADRFYNSRSFDPLEFTRLKPQDQAATLRDLAGIDTTGLDGQRQHLYDLRTQVNRDLKAEQARLAAYPRNKQAPPEELDISALSTAVTQGHAANQSAHNYDRETVSLKENTHQWALYLADLRKKLADGEADLESSKASLKAHEDAGRPDMVDVEALASKITQADDINKQVRSEKARKAAAKVVEDLQGKTDDLTAKLGQLEAQRLALLTSAKLPLPGLAISDDGMVLYNGVPLEQASQSEQLRISVAIGAALNKTLRCALVREASVLDAASLKALRQAAEDQGVQLLIEVVGDGKEVQFVIEDGQVAEDRTV